MLQCEQVSKDKCEWRSNEHEIVGGAGEDYFFKGSEVSFDKYWHIFLFGARISP